MSVDYIPRKAIPYAEILKLRELKDTFLKVQEAVDPKHDINEACVLTDGVNYLWVFCTVGKNCTFYAYGLNDPGDIFDYLETLFGTNFVSEYDDEFSDLVDKEYSEDFFTIPLPTDENPGPWKKLYPIEEKT